MTAKLILTIITAVLMTAGCLFDPDNLSRIDLANMDRPVMLGKVRKIGGGAIQPGAKKLDLDYSHYTANEQIGRSWIAYGRFDIYGDLKKKKIAPDDLIKVDEVYFESRFLLFIAYGSARTVTGIEGGLYESKKTAYSGEKP